MTLGQESKRLDFQNCVRLTTPGTVSTMEHSWTNEGLHRLILENFGQETLDLVRELEKTARKLADNRNHLRFNLRCRQSNVIPKSLQIVPPVKGHRAEKIWRRSLMQMLSERIRENNSRIDHLRNRMELFQKEIASIVSEEVYKRVIDFTQNAQGVQHKKSKERQIKKFNILLDKNNTGKGQHNRRTGTGQGETSFNRNNWVKNLSDRVLTQAEKDVLSKGLNFSVTSNHIPIADYITATEAAIRNNKLNESEAADLRLRVTATLRSAKPPPSNITPEERKALSALQKDHSINILPADKGRCTVILNTADYESKIYSLLDDTSTYERLKRDPTSGYKKKVIVCLQKLEKEEVIDRPLYYRLYPGETIPCIYGLPKIHKENAPLRPIVCSTDSITYNLAKHLTTILAPLVGNSEHHVENTQNFVDKVRHLHMDPDDVMVSYDVVSLFTCIPTSEAVTAVRKRLQEDSTIQERTKLTPEHICELLDICLSTTYFQFRGHFYRQIHGCAMGSPVSPIVANLYMEQFEKKALTSFLGTPPSLWQRYVDDTFVIIKKQELETFSEHINAVDPNIKFTREDAKGNSLAFLDCSTIRGEEGRLQTEVYRKPTHTDQYLLFDSNHPLQHKLGVIRTLQHRAQEVPTSSEGKKKEVTHVQQALSACGYPKWAFNKVKRAKKHNERKTEPNKRGVSIPYVSGLSEKLQRIFRQHDIPVYFKPGNTLRQKLVHPKDKMLTQKQSNVVYSIECSEDSCKERYIGETKQPLHKRLYQHRRSASAGPQSAVHLHLKATNHSFEDNEVKILSREKNWFERGVKEAIFVKRENPSLNRNGGLRFNLAKVYDSLLKPWSKDNSHANQVLSTDEGAIVGDQ